MQRRVGNATVVAANGNGSASDWSSSVRKHPNHGKKPRRKKKAPSSSSSSSWSLLLLSGGGGSQKKRSSLGGGRRGGERNVDSAVFQLYVSGLVLVVISSFTLYHMISTERVRQTGLDPDALKKLNVRNRNRNRVGRSSRFERFKSRIFGDGSRRDGNDDEGGQGRDGAYKGPVPDYVPFGSMYEYGDKSKRYSDLRKEYDALLPHNDTDRLKAFAESARKRSYGNMEDFAYDVDDCPDDPPEGYPKQWNILKVLENWSPDDPEPRGKIYRGICRFDHGTEMDKIRAYRDAEVPFVVRDDPEVLRTVERWNDPRYMSKLMGKTPHRTEYSPNNHFMYWMASRHDRKAAKWRPVKKVGKKIPKGWTPPTELTRMPYEEWKSHADVDVNELGPDRPHWYYRLIGCGAMGNCDRGSSEYLFDELTFFQPKESLYVVEPEKQKGIHCRFGMRGVIAENHFDGSRNMIAMIGGERRYVLSHPDQCRNLALFPKDHPSGRHSAVDWSNPDLEEYPEFRHAETNEVVLQAGDVMYLPTNWFHYIISLETNFQCNTRSGINGDYMKPIHECGF